MRVIFPADFVSKLNQCIHSPSCIAVPTFAFSMSRNNFNFQFSVGKSGCCGCIQTNGTQSALTNLAGHFSCGGKFFFLTSCNLQSTDGRKIVVACICLQVAPRYGSYGSRQKSYANNSERVEQRISSAHSERLPFLCSLPSYCRLEWSREATHKTLRKDTLQSIMLLYFSRKKGESVCLFLAQKVTSQLSLAWVEFVSSPFSAAIIM